MEAAVSLRDAGIRFRVPRRGRPGRGIPRLFGRRRTRFWGIRHVTLDVAPGEVLGLIGPNGSGKSTLLRTVSGIYAPDEGRVMVRGRVGPLLSPAAGLMTGLTGWENIELSGVLVGMTRAEARAASTSIAEFADIAGFMDAAVRVYSAGMRARLGFSIVIHAEPDILALDEVLAVGDQEFRDRSAAKIREYMESDRTVIVASHDVEGIADMCDRLVRLEHGSVVDEGSPKAVAKRYLRDHGHRRAGDRDMAVARRRARAPLWAGREPPRT